MHKRQEKLAKKELSFHLWKDEVESTLHRAAKIKDGQVGDFLRVNRLLYIETAAQVGSKLKDLAETGQKKGWEFPESADETMRRLLHVVERKRRRKI